MTVTQHSTTPRTPTRSTAVPSVEDACELYVELFTEIDKLAANSHLMTHQEFADVYRNADILKFYSYDETGALVGMSVLTRKLDAWPLISPRYFARRYPEHHRREAIWYIGFVGVLPRHLHEFRDLVTRMYPYVIRTDGIAVMDFCTYNAVTRRLPDITRKLLGQLNSGTGMELADSQSFYIYSFDQNPDGA